MMRGADEVGVGVPVRFLTTSIKDNNCTLFLGLLYETVPNADDVIECGARNTNGA